jgi:hypothetical protein
VRPTEPLTTPPVRELLIAAAVCALLAAALFAPALFAGRCTLSFPLSDPRIDVRPWARPATGPLPLVNVITPDPDLYVLPGWIRVHQLQQAGGSPWWDGAQLCGYPLAANMPMPLFLPPVWLAGFLPPVDALDLLLCFHVALAAFLAYRAARWMGPSPPAAALAAAGFSLCAWMSTRWHLPHLLYAAAYGPGVVGAWLLLRAGRWRRALIEGSLFLALAMLAFPQVGVVLAAGLLGLAVLDAATRGPARLLVAVGAAGLATLLAAPQMRLSGEAYASSLRGSPTTRAATAQQGLPPGALLGALLPDFFGRPADFSRPDPPAASMKQWLPQRRLFSEDLQDNVVENALYPGALVLLLALAALRRGAPPLARRLLLLGGGVLGLALLWPLLARVAPGVALLAAGNVKRLVVLLALVLPFAAALVLQAQLDRRERAGLLLPATLLLLALAAPLLAANLADPQAGAFARSLWPQVARQGGLLLLGLAALRVAPSGDWRAWLPAALLALDLGTFGLAFNPFPAQEPPFPITASIAQLQQRPGRIAVLGPMNLLPPTAAATAGLQSVHGVGALVPQRIAELLACIEGQLFDLRDPRVGRPFERPESLAHPLLDLLAVDTVVHADPGLAAATGLPVLFENQAEGLGALARPSAGPRAFVCGGARLVPDKEARLGTLADTAFRPHATVLLEREPGLTLPDAGPMRPAAVERVGEGLIRLETEAPFAGIAVLTESWSEGWGVRVDGEPAEALIADHALLGVALQPGPHSVEWRYEPPGLRSGVMLLGVGLAGLTVLVLFRRRSPDSVSQQPAKL